MSISASAIRQQSLEMFGPVKLASLRTVYACNFWTCLILAPVLIKLDLIGNASASLQLVKMLLEALLLLHLQVPW